MEEHRDLLATSNGDIAAFERLFFRYQPRLVYFITGMVHDIDLGHDMAQDIFLSLWENRQKLAKVENFSSYLFRIAKCSIYNYYDHLSVREKYQESYLSDCLDNSVSEEEELFAKELSAQIDQIVDQLSPQRKNIYIMSRKEGLPNEEIALKLGISKRTVENHLTAVLSILRKTIITFIIYFINS